jgi:hypothetical protein
MSDEDEDYFSDDEEVIRVSMTDLLNNAPKNPILMVRWLMGHFGVRSTLPSNGNVFKIIEQNEKLIKQNHNGMLRIPTICTRSFSVEDSCKGAQIIIELPYDIDHTKKIGYAIEQGHFFANVFAPIIRNIFMDEGAKNILFCEYSPKERIFTEIDVKLLSMS